MLGMDWAWTRLSIKWKLVNNWLGYVEKLGFEKRFIFTVCHNFFIFWIHQAPINFHHSFKVKGVQKNSGSFLLNKIDEGISQRQNQGSFPRLKSKRNVLIFWLRDELFILYLLPLNDHKSPILCPILNFNISFGNLRPSPIHQKP